MTPHQVDLVQSSFAKVAPIAHAAAAMFYGRLFEISPEVKPLFHGDMVEQRRKLMTTLGVVVNGLKNLDAVLPAARALAVKHVAYGVKAAHYAPVGEARASRDFSQPDCPSRTSSIARCSPMHHRASRG